MEKKVAIAAAHVGTPKVGIARAEKRVPAAGMDNIDYYDTTSVDEVFIVLKK